MENSITKNAISDKYTSSSGDTGITINNDKPNGDNYTNSNSTNSVNIGTNIIDNTSLSCDNNCNSNTRGILTVGKEEKEIRINELTISLSRP